MEQLVDIVTGVAVALEGRFGKYQVCLCTETCRSLEEMGAG